MSIFRDATPRGLIGISSLVCVLAPGRALASEPPVVVPVTVAVDATFRADPSWSQSVGRAFAGANDLVGTPLGIRFAVQKRAAWAPAGGTLDAYLERLRAQVGPRAGGGIVVGLTRYRPEPRHVFGATSYVDALSVLSVPFGSVPWERELAHELGHVLGAIDVDAADALMAGRGRGLRIDAMNTRLMELHRARRFPPSPFPLDGAQLEAAARMYREAALVAPAAAYRALVRLEEARGDLHAAARASASLLAARPDADSRQLHAQVMADLGLAFELAREPARALQAFEQALQARPLQPSALAGRGRLRLEEGDTAGAVDDLRRAVSADAEIPAAWANLAAAYVRLGFHDEAEYAARQELRRRPRSPQALAALALVREQRGDLGGAVEYQERAAELAPDDPAMLANLGTLLARTGQRPRALRTYLRLLDLRPDDGPCHNDVAVLYFREGCIEDARRHAARALALGAPVSPDFLAALGLASRERAASAR